MLFNLFRQDSKKLSRYAEPLDPLTADFLKRKPSLQPTRPSQARGDLAPSSIFESEDAGPSDRQVDPAGTQPQYGRRDPQVMAAALDPQPGVRKRWERKMLIRDIRGRNRLSRTDKIRRTERESLSKSHMFKTSVKKLGPLARQIAGKPIEDAIIQMRFSPKKAAKDLKKHLEYARDEAIVKRGMGLGAVEGTGAVEGGELIVEDKKGKRRVVKDKTQMYVDQAWVGRGTYGRAPDFRARGRVYLMRPPHTSESSPRL